MRNYGVIRFWFNRNTQKSIECATRTK